VSAQRCCWCHDASFAIAQEVRRACDALMETHEDAIADTFHRCVVAARLWRSSCPGCAGNDMLVMLCVRRWVQAGGEAAQDWSWGIEARHASHALPCIIPAWR
jgi:hypothetical protein